MNDPRSALTFIRAKMIDADGEVIDNLEELEVLCRMYDPEGDPSSFVFTPDTLRRLTEKEHELLTMVIWVTNTIFYLPAIFELIDSGCEMGELYLYCPCGVGADSPIFLQLNDLVNGTDRDRRSVLRFFTIFKHYYSGPSQDTHPFEHIDFNQRTLPFWDQLMKLDFADEYYEYWDYGDDDLSLYRRRRGLCEYMEEIPSR
jgi:hypothetical protein